MIHFKAIRPVLVVALVAVWLSGPVPAQGLDTDAVIYFDQNNLPTIFGKTEHDVIFLQGYMHARDRMFQMDFQRRVFAGKASELVGSALLPTDIQLRTLGLARAAARSLPIQTPQVLAWLEAYSDGVNAFLANESLPLPVEYSALEIDRDGIPPWTPMDSLVTVKGLAFNLSFDLGDINRTLALLNFRGVGNVLGFNGFQLYNNDLYPTHPFDPTVSIPGVPVAADAPDAVCSDDGEPFAMAVGECQGAIPFAMEEEEPPAYMSDPDFQALLQDYRDKVAEVPLLKERLESDFTERGSNWWVVSGARTESGFPMIANDPHLALGTPSTFYEVHLIVSDGSGEGLNVVGTSFPGAPGVVLGCNPVVCWGATVNALDVTDVYNEVLLPLNPLAPFSPTHTLFNGVPEPLNFIPQTFNFNIIGDGVPNNTVNAGIPATSGGVTLIVPRRNNGPIVRTSFNPASPTPLTGLSVQYVGWSGTQELETFRRFARAENLGDFKDALQFFDHGSQNWAYADINGNIAYYTSGELPIREDLQFGFFPAGLQPPYLIRDGTHTNSHEWLPVLHPQPKQALANEILPFAEMPQVENPASGYILNANNDPIGTTLNNVAWDGFRVGFNGRLYLAPGYATGFRIGRIQQLFDDFQATGPFTLAQSIAMQGNNQLLDAEVFVPYVLAAFANATAPGAHPALAPLGADPRVVEAIGRLAAWDFSTPTGINEGFDPGDNPAAPGPPSAAEVEASISATIYSVWRGQFVQRVIDHTLASLPVPLNAYAPGTEQSMVALRNFLEDYPVTGGTGASLLNFFVVPGVFDPFAARDIIILGTLQAGLNLLASNQMAPAYANSTDQNDYRWGKLHRIVFAHTLGGPFNIPPTGSPSNLSPALPGFARAGGMGAVDASSHSARSDGLNEFMFSSGPSRRFQATMTPDGPEALEVLPGGESGIPGNPSQVDQLALWLVNGYHPLPIALQDVIGVTTETVGFSCGQDIDGDGFRGGGDALCNDSDDCNDQNPAVWGAPGEVRDVQFADKLTLLWNSPIDLGATSVLYDVVRSANLTDFVNDAVCDDFDVSDTVTQIATVPARGQLIGFLVRAQNNCLEVGQGSGGEGAGGAERATRSCP